jgi:hypothetical protein
MGNGVQMTYLGHAGYILGTKQFIHYHFSKPGSKMCLKNNLCQPFGGGRTVSIIDASDRTPGKK